MKSETEEKIDEYREVISRLERLEQGQETLEKEYVLLRNEFNSFRSEEFNGFRMEVNQRFDIVNQRFDTLRQDIDQRLDLMNDRILKSMRWSVGTIALFGAIITALVTIFKLTG